MNGVKIASSRGMYLKKEYASIYNSCPLYISTESFIGPFDGDNNNNENETSGHPRSTSTVNIRNAKKSEDQSLKSYTIQSLCSSTSKISVTGATPRATTEGKAKVKKSIPQSSKEKRWSSWDKRGINLAKLF